jgi:hypothetical protein
MKKQYLVGLRRSFLRALIFALIVQSGFLSGVRADDVAGKIFDPPTLYATWSTDPTTSMDIMWTLPNFAEAGIGAVYYREKAQTNAAWVRGQGRLSPFPYSTDVLIRVHLQSLKPDTEYSFHFETNKQYPAFREYSFRTMPATLNRPLRFAFGGDVNVTDQAVKVSKMAMVHSPEFILFGGDLAYTNSTPKAVEKEKAWLGMLKECFISPSGRLIPILAAIGNHETYNSNDYASARPLEKAPYYYTEFPFPGIPAYGVLDFGRYMSIIMLEAHTTEVGGAQTAWLKKTLQARRHVPHVFPIYHVPQYPVYRDFNGEWSAAERKNWGPLFEKYGVRIAFENHDHAYKRTHPLRDGKVVADGKGIVYIGDGAWGVKPRELKGDNRWYLAKALSTNYFGIATIQPSRKGSDQFFRIFNAESELVDAYPATR